MAELDPDVIARLAVGQTYTGEHTPHEQEQHAYWQAVLDGGSLDLTPAPTGLLAGMSVAAGAVRLLMEQLQLPAGSVHLAQTLTFEQAPEPGVPLRHQSRVTRARPAGGALLVELELETVRAADGVRLLSGKSTLVVAPEGGPPIPETPATEPENIDITATGPSVPLRLEAGASLPTARWEITQERVRRYAEITGDLNPLHLDAAYARCTPFGRPIAHGLLLLGYLVALLDWTCQPRLSDAPTLAVRFKAPAWVNAPVLAGGQVQSVDAATGAAQCALWVRDEPGRVLVECSARVAGGGW